MRVLKLILKQFHCLKKATINFCRIKVAAKHSTEFPNEKQLLLIFSEGFNFRRCLMARAGAEETKTQNQNWGGGGGSFSSPLEPFPPLPEKGHMCEEEEEEGKMCPAWRQDCVAGWRRKVRIYLCSGRARAHFLETLEEEEEGSSLLFGCG